MFPMPQKGEWNAQLRKIPINGNILGAVSQSWIIVQPKTSDCQLNTGEDFQISIKIQKNLKAWSFLLRNLNFSHNYKFKNNRKRVLCKPLNRHQYQKKECMFNCGINLYFSSISKLKFPHRFFKHIWNYNACIKVKKNNTDIRHLKYFSFL